MGCRGMVLEGALFWADVVAAAAEGEEHAITARASSSTFSSGMLVTEKIWKRMAAST